MILSYRTLTTLGQIWLLFLPALIIVATGCRKQSSSESGKVLVRYKDSYLNEEDVVSKIPVGLSETDSLALFQNIIDSWITDRLLGEIAEKELPDKDIIESKVSQYKNRLIVTEYMSRLRARGDFDIEEDSLQSYYNTYKNQHLLTQPLLKGIIIKIDQNSPNADKLRKYLKNPIEENIDKIENLRLNEDFNYQYFIDEWLDWNTVSGKLSVSMLDPDKTISRNSFIDSTKNGMLCMMYVSDFLPSGHEPPYQYVRSSIKDILMRAEINNYEKEIINMLYEKALRDNKLELLSEK